MLNCAGVFSLKERQGNMRTRDASYWDYGISEAESKELIEICRNADSQTELLLLKAAQEACMEYASSLFYSLRNNLSYEDVCSNNYLYIGKGDFYGHRRKTLYLLKEKIMENEKVIVEKWKLDGCLRRYVSIEDAAAEMQLKEDKVRTIARKANAIIQIGRTCRVNMIALYDYIDRECAVS